MTEVQGAPYVGVVTDGSLDSITSSPIQLPGEEIVRKAALEENPEPNVLSDPNMTDQMKLDLLNHLKSRLVAGNVQRNRRIKRYAKIDRTISTWQQLNKDDSERETIEDNTGRQTALPMNLPILASHLNDMSSYFTESLAPISNPFFSASGEGQIPNLLKAFNEDALRRNYYGELSLTVRSMIKYNIGGMSVEWDSGSLSGAYADAQPGNRWTSLNMYNTLWDPAITDPTKVYCKAEWAATVCIENRLELVRKTLAGEWVGLEKMLSTTSQATRIARFYREPAVEATLGEQGQDSRTGTGSQAMNWSSWGLGQSSDLGPEVDGYEVVDMYCWLIPEQHGLLTDAEKTALETSYGKNPKTYLELWRFKIVGGEHLVDAKVVVPRDASTAGEACEIPMYLAFFTNDQIKEAQRSFMELMRGFQRFGSAMYNIYIAGMRKNVWGVIGVDNSMFDSGGLAKGDTVGILPSKIPGRDVRSGIMALNNSAGVDQALTAVDASLAMKDKFFPSQALPSQIAGIDRAVKSQVATVIQGGQRALRTLVRTLDSGMLLPTRMSAFRNLKRNGADGINTLTDEDVAKMLGSGIESMEAERVSEALWQLVYAIIQNVEANQTFDVPMILTYLSRIDNLSVDLGKFVRAPAQPAVAAPGNPAGAASAIAAQPAAGPGY